MEIKNPEKLAKVNVSRDIKVNIPCVKEDETPGFEEIWVFGANGEVLDVLLPEKVVNDKRTLTNYLREQHESWVDLPAYGQINIWDENKDIPEKGTFRFGWGWDGSKTIPDEKITADL